MKIDKKTWIGSEKAEEEHCPVCKEWVDSWIDLKLMMHKNSVECIHDYAKHILSRR